MSKNADQEKIEKILNKIKSQKKELIEWENQLLNRLSTNMYKKQNLYLIKEEWLTKYKNDFFNEKIKKDSKLIKNYENFEPINNDKLFDSFTDPKIKIKKFLKVFPLNINCLESFKKESKGPKPTKSAGTFYNKSLIINIGEKNYCFFFIDKKKQLRQGYLKIANNNNESKVIEDIQNKGIDEYLNFYKNEIKDKELLFKNEQIKIKILEFSKKKDIINIINESQNSTKNNKNKELIKDNTEKENNSLNNKNQIIDKEKIKKIRNNLDATMDDRKRINCIYNFDATNNINKLLNNDLNEEKKNETEDCLNLVKLKEFNPERKLINKKSYKRAASVYRSTREFGKKIFKKKDSLDLASFCPIKVVEKLSTPGLIGLLNIGATCYMNATLQSFSNLPRLRAQLINKEFYQYLEKNDKKLSFSLAEVIKNLWENLKQRFYSPEKFKKLISEMNPLFKGIAANDPKDLVLFLLETIHKELNNPPLEKKKSNYVPDERNFIQVYNDFTNFYLSKNKSIISDEFHGFTNNMTICELCKNTIHSLQSIIILFFPLEEIRKYMGYKINSVRMTDCFDYYEKIEIFSSFYCNYCKNNCQAYSQSKLVYAPKTLIINLNRGKGIEFNVNIIFEEYLNLRKYIYASDSPYYYELTAVICHFGSNDMGGHFIAYCKNSNNCEWYKFNDQFVTKCSFNEVCRTGLPYVLFYSYVQV